MINSDDIVLATKCQLAGAGRALHPHLAGVELGRAVLVPLTLSRVYPERSRREGVQPGFWDGAESASLCE